MHGYSSGAHYASGGGHAYYGGGGHAVPRGYASGGRTPSSGAQYRHPIPGHGTGSHGHGYGYGYGYGHSHGYGYGYGYGHGHAHGYGYGYYGHYPYYYGYAPYGFGLSFSFGYPYGYYAPYYAPYYPPAPYYGGYASDQSYQDQSYQDQSNQDQSYQGGENAGDQGYYDRNDARNEGRAAGAELRLVVQPDDASVWIDGEFRGVARGLARVTLAPGRHELEIVRPGFQTASRDVELHPGASVSVHTELARP